MQNVFVKKWLRSLFSMLFWMIWLKFLQVIGTKYKQTQTKVCINGSPEKGNQNNLNRFLSGNACSQTRYFFIQNVTLMWWTSQYKLILELLTDIIFCFFFVNKLTVEILTINDKLNVAPWCHRKRWLCSIRTRNT